MTRDINTRDIDLRKTTLDYLIHFVRGVVT